MRRFGFVAFATGMLALLGACSTPGIPYERSSAQVKTIGVVTPGFPDQPTVFLASNVGQSFGLIGGLIEAGMQSDRETKFKAILKDRKYAAHEHFLEALSAALQAQGYTVSRVAMSRKGTDFIEKYPTTAELKIDAYLDVVTMSFG